MSPFFNCSTGDIFGYNVIQPFDTVLFRTGDIIALPTVGSKITPLCRATVNLAKMISSRDVRVLTFQPQRTFINHFDRPNKLCDLLKVYMYTFLHFFINSYDYRTQSDPYPAAVCRPLFVCRGSTNVSEVDLLAHFSHRFRINV